MREGTRIGGAWLLAALALGAGWTTASAQPAPPSSYQLPPASPSPDPNVQGPVIEEHPVVTPSTAATPTPAPVPVIAPPRPAPTAAPSPAATHPAPRPAPAAQAPLSVEPTPAPTVRAAPPSPAATLPPPPPAALPPLPEPQTAQAASSEDVWPWYVAGAVLATAIALALFWLARRRAVRPEREAALPATAVPSPSPPAAPLPVAPAPTAPAPSAAPASGPALTVSLEARRFSATLVNASLDYRLRVTNTGTQPLANITIGGDMIGAHASIPAEAQFAHEGDALEPRHTIASLALGETAELTGTLRLPLAGATAIRQGTAALFVPLVRLCARAGTDAPAIASTHVVGEAPIASGGGLRPFRLDLGPRIYGQVEQRKLAVPA